IGRDREVGGRGQHAQMRQQLLARGCAVPLAERKGEAGAGGRQGFVAERGKNACAARIPRVGNDKRARAPVQRLESLALFRLTDCHRSLPWGVLDDWLEPRSASSPFLRQNT